MQLNFSAENVIGLDKRETDRLNKLIEIFNYHSSKNAQKNKYYEGNISLADVNLGIALPEGLRKLEIGCAWGSKTVDVLASRSMFDGFVGASGNDINQLNIIAANNRLVEEYAKACRDELKYGCTFATLSADADIKCKIRFHSPQTAAGMWDGEKGRMSCGFAIVDSELSSDLMAWIPTVINYHTDYHIWVLKFEKSDNNWHATPHAHKMGRPLMEPMIWNATSNKPFGRSRIKEPVRRLIDGYVRTLANATIGLEFATSPQKYLLGVTDEQYDALINQKFKQYVGSILASTYNPETGSNPQFGQLPQGSIQPHVEMVRILATQFSAATGLSVSDTGVVNDANPTSSDAIIAQTKSLVAMAEQLNRGNGETLHTIAVMALAIANNVKIEELPASQTDVIAHFKNPAMPSLATTADAAIKIASAREGFANTDTFLEMIGFDQADIRRIKSEERRNRGLEFLKEFTAEPEEEAAGTEGNEPNEDITE